MLDSPKIIYLRQSIDYVSRKQTLPKTIPSGTRRLVASLALHGIPGARPAQVGGEGEAKNRNRGKQVPGPASKSPLNFRFLLLPPSPCGNSMLFMMNYRVR